MGLGPQDGYSKFVERYYGVSYFPSLWREGLLILLLNIPFYLHAEFNDNFFIFIIPWVLVLIGFSVLVINLDMTRVETLHNDNPEEFNTPRVVKLKLILICSTIYELGAVVFFEAIELLYKFFPEFAEFDTSNGSFLAWLIYTHLSEFIGPVN
jgi:hypothetical protein